MTKLHVDGRQIIPFNFICYEDLIRFEIPEEIVQVIFPNKTESESYNLVKDDVNWGYFKVLSVTSGKFSGRSALTLHRQ